MVPDTILVASLPPGQLFLRLRHSLVSLAGLNGMVCLFLKSATALLSQFPKLILLGILLLF